MPQSLSAAYMHIVFSTKNRLPLIIPELRSPLWMYLGGVCRGLHCMPVQIGGTSDHVHILSLLARDIAIQALIAKVKAESSRWMKTQKQPIPDFQWQTGYGIFSVSPKDRRGVIEYIANQEEHHRTRTFQEEFLLFLKKYDVPYDENHLWDEP